MTTSSVENQIDREFIVALQETDGALTTVKVTIERPAQLIAELKAMVENPRCTVLDMARAFTSHYRPTANALDYIAPHDLNEHGGNDSKDSLTVAYPKCLSMEQLRNSWAEAEKDGEEYCKDKCARERRQADAGYIRNCRNKFKSTLIKKQKTEYMAAASRWIDAESYLRTADRLWRDSSIKCFSKEGVGFHTYNHQISEDLRISIRTNFGYASASYFLLGLQYKGIHILPYSHLVKFYHANMNDLLRCTRVYKLERESWIEAFDYVSTTVEGARQTPEEFIENHVIGEVRGMMAGLRRLVADPKAVMEEIGEYSLGHQRSVYCRTRVEKQDMLTYGDEMALLFKMEKISGAHKFVDNLSKLGEACPRIREELDGYIAELTEMHAALRQEVEEGMAAVSQRISGAERVLLGAQMELKMVTEALSPLYARYRELQEAAKQAGRVYRLVDFARVAPNFITLQEQSKTLKKSVHDHRKTLTSLNNFLRFMTDFLRTAATARQAA